MARLVARQCTASAGALAHRAGLATCATILSDSRNHTHLCSFFLSYCALTRDHSEPPNAQPTPPARRRQSLDPRLSPELAWPELWTPTFEGATPRCLYCATRAGDRARGTSETPYICSSRRHGRRAIMIRPDHVDVRRLRLQPSHCHVRLSLLGGRHHCDVERNSVTASRNAPRAVNTGRKTIGLGLHSAEVPSFLLLACF